MSGPNRSQVWSTQRGRLLFEGKASGDARADEAWLPLPDIGDPNSLGEAFRGTDAVLHLAALVSFWSGDRDRLFLVNQIGTRNVAHACVRAGVKRLVHVSSVAAIGFNDREDEPASEDLDFDWGQAAAKHYMLSKRASELELDTAARAGARA